MQGLISTHSLEIIQIRLFCGIFSFFKRELETKFADLRKLVSEREVRLSEALQYFQFLHEYNDVQEWMREQMNKADSEEYGNDLEHVELLIQAFDTFHASLVNSEPRVLQCVENGQIIIDAKSSYR